MPKCAAFAFRRSSKPEEPFVRCAHDATHGEYCIFHAPSKSSNEFKAALEPLLEHPTLDISEFVFPSGFVFEIPESTHSLRARRTRFGGPVVGVNRTLSGLVYLRGSKFEETVDLSHTTFAGTVNLQDTLFAKPASFEACRFTGGVAFLYMARFMEGANFSHIESQADFVVQYMAARSVDFSRSTFTGAFKSYGIDVLEQAAFKYVNFQGRVFAEDSHFGEVDFSGSEFHSASRIGLSAEGWQWMNEDEPEADEVPEVEDETDVDLMDEEDAEEFSGFDWESPEDKYWYELQWPQPSYRLSDLTLSPQECHARFWEVQPGDQLLVTGDLRFAEFNGTYLASIDMSTARWPTIGKRKALYEEIGLRSEMRGGEYLTFTDPEEIAALYRGLRKQYEDRLAYHEASDFHIGEMEMRRLAGYDPWSEPFGRLRSIRRIWRSVSYFRRRYCSLTAMYSYASRYGESYLRPLGWTLAVMVFFTPLYLLTGFYEQGPDRSPLVQYELDLSSGTLPAASDAAAALSLSLSSFFLRTAASGMGLTSQTRILVVIESVIGASLIALFALSLRRHFKR